MHCLVILGDETPPYVRWSGVGVRARCRR